MLYLRGLLFTLVVPGAVGVWVPAGLHQWQRPALWWPHLGWIPIALGAMFYGLALAKFLAAGGTPMIYFARLLRFVLGEEPAPLVEHGLYRLTRNPMYAGVISAVIGQSILFASAATASYALILCGWFHLVVTFLEEPHLYQLHGRAYEAYCRRVPRWI